MPPFYQFSLVKIWSTHTLPSAFIHESEIFTVHSAKDLGDFPYQIAHIALWYHMKWENEPQMQVPHVLVFSL